MYDLKLSVVIVNYKVKYFLEQCLYALREAVSGLEAEIFVVDNASGDDSVAYLRPLFPEVVFIENTDNPGFARANNQAIREARGEYILLLNPDTVVGEENLRTLCYFLDEHPEAGGVGVKMLDGHGRFLAESKRAFPTPWVSFCKLFGLSKLFPRSRRFARYSLPFLEADKEHEVEVLAGAYMLLRHEALDKVGLLDEAFFMYGEDIDLSYRVVLGGYKNYYLPERILHYKGESTKKGDMKYIRAFYGAMLIFYKKYYPRSGWMVSGMIRLAVVLSAALSIVPRKTVSGGAPKGGRRRILVLCSGRRWEVIKSICAERMPEAEFINHWNLDEERATDVICRRNQMKGFTDYVFCFPDLRFEQMLLLMDTMVNKRMVYHIYNSKSGRLVSPGK